MFSLNLKKIIFCSFFFLILKLTAQQKNIKVVVNSITKEPISYALIYSKDRKINLTSNTEGKFMFFQDGKINEYLVYKIGFEPKTLSSAYLMTHDTISLKEKPTYLSEVIVKPKQIDTLILDKRFYIDDYIVLPNNDFLILTSKINIKGFELSYFKRNRGVTCTKKLKVEVNPEFHYDCFKNYHLVTSNYSRQLLFDTDSSFEFLPKYSRAKFDSTLGNVALKIDSFVIVKKNEPTKTLYSKHFQMNLISPFLYYYKIHKKKADLFYTVSFNEHLMTMIKNELHDWEVSVYQVQSSTIAQAIQGIQNFETLVLKNIYAPMYLKNDTVVLFNFQEMEILFLDKNGKNLKKIKLDEAELPIGKNYGIIYDENPEKFYIKVNYHDRIILSQLNIYNGKII